MTNIQYTAFNAHTQTLGGYNVIMTPLADKSYTVHNTWAFSLPIEETFSTLVEPTNAPISSFGRILGDRSTLYSYLNPHLIAFATVRVDTNTASVYVIDSITGDIAFSKSIQDVDAVGGIEVMLEGNWLVYTYTENVDGRASHRLVTVELYEGDDVNAKTGRYVFTLS